MIDIDKYEEYQNARVEGFIPAEWEFEDYLLAEVKRLQAWKNEMTDIINEAKDMENTDDSRPRAIWWNLQYKLKEMIE